MVGLGYGDEGKGSIVDSLCATTGASAVVRFNGGAQAAHNVVLLDGRHHTFAQWGSGTFRGARTILSKFMLVHPTAALIEAQHLAAKGIRSPLSMLTIDGRCKITTPYHQAANRLRELARGTNRHGSCGVGIGETMQDAAEGLELTARDLRDDPKLVMEKLANIRAHKLVMLADMDRVRLPRAALAEITILERADVMQRIADSYRMFAMNVEIVDRVTLPSNTDVVFEGAQGILLDETYGFHPYTTWSTTTSRNAFAVMDEVEWSGGHRVIGITRAYSTRHGQGPFVPWDAMFDEGLMGGEHNGVGDWQGSFRNGPIDTLTLQYALEVDQAVDCLAITCLDRIAACSVAARSWEACTGYNLAGNKGLLRRIPLDNLLAGDLDRQAEITQLISGATPELTKLPWSAPDKGPLVPFIQGVTSRPVACVSWGPTSEDKYWFDVD